MAFSFRDVRRHLKMKGFVETKDSHHIYLHHEYQGRRTGPYTYVSHGSGKEDVGNDIVRKMKRQLKLTSSQEVRDLVLCPMDGDDYLSVLQREGIID